MEWVGIKTGTLSHLRPVLEEWLALNQQCVDTWKDGDIPWRYDERATVSYFAGAIWRRGGFAIAEYSRHKSNLKGDFGFGDLWFEFQDKEYDIEAKQCRISLNEPFEPKATIEIGSSMAKAMHDIAVSTAYDSKRTRCALLASILTVDLTKPDYEGVLFSEELLEARLARWIEIIKSTGDTVAWFIRADKQWGVCSEGRNPDVLFPGVALIIRTV